MFLHNPEIANLDQEHVDNKDVLLKWYPSGLIYINILPKAD